ncbi:hypothetical protein KVR01_011291 [Diaporthe batatas]|uniref:uncharacterized protein n=1 Tax=Diaporthe batatas TaxID=748121 RepID=UPI001D03B0BB|nr:uncharacterized protein KVR01_011291 [Diaporthe batatas]KAG8158848.1 hypothetical protein KVR01_011291 [Diaporthe batatas]
MQASTTAALLVAGSAPGGTRRRLSFRRVERWAEPDQPEGGKSKSKEAVELLLWSDIEEWQQRGSDHIQTGYRRACGNVKGCLLSWTYIHNETVNIWSHILGALVFTSLTALVLTEIPARYHAATAADFAVCSTYFVGVAVCFALSTAFHTLMAHSEAVYLLNMKLDFQGVLILMWAATVPLVYYTFPCEGDRYLRAGYWALISGLAVTCSAVTFLPRFSGPHLGPYRALLFGTFGAGSFALPIAHGAVRHGLGEEWERVGLGWVLWTVVCDGVGVLVYGLKFPERWFPRRFDLFGASHQLMHIFVVLAALTYTCAVISAFDHRYEKGAVC